MSEDGKCAYPMDIYALKTCDKQTVMYERYCEDHIRHVHKRTNIFDEIMPDHPDAAWMKRKTP